MKDHELLREPTAEALTDDDEWKLFVSRATLDQIELEYGSDPKFASQVNYEKALEKNVQGH